VPHFPCVPTIKAGLARHFVDIRCVFRDASLRLIAAAAEMRSRRKRKRDYATAMAMAMACWRMCVSVWLGGYLGWCRCFSWRPLRHAGRHMVTLSLLSPLSPLSPPSPCSPALWVFVPACAWCRAGCIILTSFQVFTRSVYNFGFWLSLFFPTSSYLCFLFRFFCVAVLLLCC